AGGTGRLEDARGKQRAALRDLGRLELVAQALFERQRLASPGASVQISKVAVQRVRHLVDGRRRFGAKQLNEGIFRRAPASRGFCHTLSMPCNAPSAAVEMPRTKICPNGSR